MKPSERIWRAEFLREDVNAERKGDRYGAALDEIGRILDEQAVELAVLRGTLESIFGLPPDRRVVQRLADTLPRVSVSARHGDATGIKPRDVSEPIRAICSRPSGHSGACNGYPREGDCAAYEPEGV